MGLETKVVIVTGGSRGIGRSIVKAFAKAGAEVLFTYHSHDSSSLELQKELSQFKVKSYKLDVRDFSAVEQWKERILCEYPHIDILINNAGIIKDKALALMSKEEWHEVIDTNLNAVFNVTKAFIISFMKQKQGNIINISSLSGITGIPRQTNYSASKGGIIAFSKSLAKEVASYNIRVNVIAPGFIHTDMTKGLKEDYVKQVTAQIPLGRFGSCEEVAKAALFLASEDSNYITGQVLRVDGGLGM